MKLEIINPVIYTNPYQRLLFCDISNRYLLTKGSIHDAISKIKAGKKNIYHIHWEESLFKNVTCTTQAKIDIEAYVLKLKYYNSLGGKILWTVHNIKPHDINPAFDPLFLILRKNIAALSQRIIVHNNATIEMLRDQIDLLKFSRKIKIIPHPSYTGIYEKSETTNALAINNPNNSRKLIYFGYIRPYKGLSKLIDFLSADFMLEHELSMGIFGKPIGDEESQKDLENKIASRSEITHSLDIVPNDRLPDILRSGAGIIIPYHKVVSSGVANLALTLGIPAIAPNTPAMRELFPEIAHHLLFIPDSEVDLKRAVLALLNLNKKDRSSIAQSYLEKASKYNARTISRMLGKIYDQILQTNK